MFTLPYKLVVLKWKFQKFRVYTESKTGRNMLDTYTFGVVVGATVFLGVWLISYL